ncbi:unnamed protein product [Arctia plantaginis]|uniref:Uncharacterized protein n=1 Tax=Arctia plantaginis TaxID=874455 RepID=A0A8S0Z8R6_ARCPL|nr:unnamed protein product [Arctia plantaginis]
MKKFSVSSESPCHDGFGSGSLNWLLHARYVRGEHALCLELADQLQKQHENKHRFAHYIKGSVLADAGRLQEALEKYHNCIRLQPQDPEPLKQVAKCLSRQGRFQLSHEAYLEANKLSNHPDPDIYSALAECCWHLGELERGVEWARSAVQAGGGERAAALLAKLLLASDDIQGALNAYDQALSTHACGADTLAEAGALRLRSGDPRSAFQLLGAALAQQPTQHAAALALAAMMLQHRDLDAALARLKAALTAHPTCVAAHTNLGMALLSKKKYIAVGADVPAARCLDGATKRACGTQPGPGFTRVQTPRIRLLPPSYCCSSTTISALHGIALERLGDSRADAAYSRAVALATDDPLIRLNLAGRHARAGRVTQAVEEAAITAELIQKEEKPDAQLASSLASLLALLKDAGVGLSQLPVSVPKLENAKPANSNDAAIEEEQLQSDEIECKERTASLVVLPPLVIGYEELYNDSPENGKNVTQNVEQDAKGKEIVIDGINEKNIKDIVNGEIDKLMQKDKTIEQKDAGTLIDVKGRRRNYRRSQRGRRRQRIIENTE